MSAADSYSALKAKQSLLRNIVAAQFFEQPLTCHCGCLWNCPAPTIRESGETVQHRAAANNQHGNSRLHQQRKLNVLAQWSSHKQCREVQLTK